MSPDYEYSLGYEGNPAGGDLTVDPIDLGGFIGAYQGGIGPDSCHNYNNILDPLTDPVDLGTFIDSYKGGANFCNP
jgi:hypothetical protein